MLFSIIVPIYKVESYLPQCIESVLKQEFEDFELILVNDGSPDNCGVICNNYAELDERITVIHKKNGGLSDARNSGLEHIQGDYVIFLDSDDYMSESVLSKIASVIKDNETPDMISCAHINTYPNGDEVYKELTFHPLSQIINREQLYGEFVRTSSSNWSASKNVYCREIIESNNLKFKLGLIGAEDCDFFMRFIREGTRFIFLNFPIIHYRRNREGSITTSMSKEAILGQLEVFYENYCIYKNENILNTNIQGYFANKFANTVSLLSKLDGKSNIKEVESFIQKHKKILKKTEGIKYSFAKIMWLIFGYYRGSVLLKYIKNTIRNFL